MHSSVKKRMSDSYGENREIAGAADPALVAVCCNGSFVGRRVGETIAFRGVPFAKPPVGELRWQRPVAPDPDDRTYEAYYNGKTPIQTEWPTEVASYYPQGEDCLYLNVWKNPSDTSEKKAVMVFFHGGSYGWGGTADPLYDGTNLVTAHPEIVLVTAGYRTGLMGFVDFSKVPGGDRFPDAPNLGIWDQIEALRWVKQNIAAFGGDPELVTIFGESAGGGSVSILPFIDEAKGLFKRSIAESGSVALTFSKEECQDFTRRLLKASGAISMDDLMALSEDDLKRVNEAVNMYNNFPQRDGVLIPEDPYEPYARGKTAHCDLMIGTNSNEINYWVGELGGIAPFRFGIPVKLENDLRSMNPAAANVVRTFLKKKKGHPVWKMAEFYNEMMFRLPAIRQAEEHCKHGGKVYMYFWKVPSTIRFRGACHAVELAYVFGNLEETIYTGKQGKKSISDMVQRMWVNFAKTGNPSTVPYRWPKYGRKYRATMIIDWNTHVEMSPLDHQRRMLSPLLDEHINMSYADMSYNVPYVRGVAAVGALTLAALGGTAAMLIKKRK